MRLQRRCTNPRSFYALNFLTLRGKRTGQYVAELAENLALHRKTGRRPLQDAGLSRRGLLIGHFGSAAVRDPDGQNELEPRPILAVRQRRKFAAVTLDYHAANGQSQSHSIWLCRDEWIKYAV